MEESELKYQSSAASLFASRARVFVPTFVVRACPGCGLSYACQIDSKFYLVCPVCQSLELLETSTQVELPEKWSEYLDAYIGESLAGGADWVAVAQKKCFCLKFMGDNLDCPIHGRE
jgi:hypothetical protein